MFAGAATVVVGVGGAAMVLTCVLDGDDLSLELVDVRTAVLRRKKQVETARQR